MWAGVGAEVTKDPKSLVTAWISFQDHFAGAERVSSPHSSGSGSMKQGPSSRGPVHRTPFRELGRSGLSLEAAPMQVHRATGDYIPLEPSCDKEPVPRKRALRPCRTVAPRPPRARQRGGDAPRRPASRRPWRSKRLSSLSTLRYCRPSITLEGDVAPRFSPFSPRIHVRHPESENLGDVLGISWAEVAVSNRPRAASSAAAPARGNARRCGEPVLSSPIWEIRRLRTPLPDSTRSTMPIALVRTRITASRPSPHGDR